MRWVHLAILAVLLTAVVAAADAPAVSSTPAAGTITGVVQALGENRLIVSVGKDLKTVDVQAATTVLRHGQPAKLTDLRLGDQVEAVTDAQGHTTSVKATYETLTGKVVARSSMQLTLDSHQGALAVDPATEVTGPDGATPAMYSDIATGDTVTVRLTPGTTRVYGITLGTTPATPPMVTPGPAPALPYTPLPPGRITPASGGALAPTVVIYGPFEGERTYLRLPDLAVEFTDYSGSGLDWDRCTATVTGPEGPVVITTRRRGRQLMLRVDPLPVGLITVTADGYDHAGHHTQQQLTFTISGETAPLGPLYLSHNAAGRALMPGDLLRVTAAGPVNGQAFFILDLGDGGHREEGAVGVHLFGRGWGGGFLVPFGQGHRGSYSLRVPMIQLPSLPGTYRGGVVVPNIDVDQTLSVAVVAVGALGRVWSGTAPRPVHLIMFRPLQPHVIAPTPGAHAGGQATVEGYTEPYATVNCTLAAQAPALAGAGWSAQLTLYADGDGYFLSDPVKLGGPDGEAVSYSLTATASQDTRQSKATTLSFVK